MPQDMPAFTQFHPPKQRFGNMRKEYQQMGPIGNAIMQNVQDQQLLRFRLPNVGYLMPSETSLHFGIKLNAQETAGTVVRFGCLGAHAVIDRFKVIIQGQVIEDLTHYHDICRIVQLTNSREYFQGPAGVLEGTADQVATDLSDGDIHAYGDTIDNSATPKTQYYCIHFNSGLLGPSAHDLWPLHAMRDVTIEIYLAGSTKVFRASSNDATLLTRANTAVTKTYDLTDIKLNLSVYTMEPNFTQTIDSDLRSGRTIKIMFNTYTCVTAPLANTNHNVVNVPVALADVTHVLFLQKPSSLSPDKSDVDFYGGSTFVSGRIQIGGQNIPNIELKNSTEQLCHFLRSFGKVHARANPIMITKKSWTAAAPKSDVAMCFVPGYDIRDYHSYNTLTGHTVMNNMSYHFTESAALVDKSVDIMVGHSKMLIISAEGVGILQ